MKEIQFLIFNYQFLIVSGGLAQLVERLLCKQDVSGSSPLTSTCKKPRTDKSKFSNMTQGCQTAEDVSARTLKTA
jgi:hypothetical protein